MGYVSSVSSTVIAYEPITTSGEVTFSGLGNGTDFDEIIDATISAESYKLDDYEDQKTETEYIIDLLEQLDEAIDDFNDNLDDIDEPDEFYSMEGTCSSDEVEVEVTGEADVGIHTIIVDQLAQTDIWVSTDTGYDSEETVITNSATTLEVSFQGETISIDVAAGTTLEGLVSTINGSVDARDKIEADLMYDGDSYYFTLKSTDSGEDNILTITDTGTLIDMSTTSFTNTQVGQNAKIKVDGFPADADEWIERDSNSIDDVVDGITFDLLETTDSEGVRVSVSYDTDDMFDTIIDFVDELNQVILDIQVLTGRVTEEEDSDEDAYTVDNYALDIVYNNIKDILSSGALGFTAYDEDEGGDYYNALSQIGFSTDTDEGSDTFGLLLVDEDDLEDALDTDPEAVAALFAERAVGESDSENFQVISVIDGVTNAGEHTVEYTMSGGVITSATINGEEAYIEGLTILGTDSQSKGLYISVSDQGDGDYSGVARVKQGKIGELSDALDNITDEDSGTMVILIDNYEESLTSLDNQIYNEEKRLDALETSLTRRYAALDATLSTYSNTSDLLTSLLSQLG
ncbi:flagellar filament capping protein FliD [Pseudodesulfovibrio sediminis]|uniref:Flagellar hook-associated protein 2 n=1 Tax=Pseudodesulfovibrio sediminis TaxID=2810563 RepID=A0ABM7P489_9BACT|nr:flagellar filament capping protein FliD [Pseudodesulfovibrio sediminis]BCS87653.1 flagellar hook-associated protein 2 [Pseudodesulfovibrio sediminis]